MGRTVNMGLRLTVEMRDALDRIKEERHRNTRQELIIEALNQVYFKSWNIFIKKK